VVVGTDFFEWGNGFGLLCVCREGAEASLTQHRSSWIIRLDAQLNRTGVFGVGEESCFGAVGAGPRKTVAALMQSSSFAFVTWEGERHVIPVAPAPEWAEKMFGPPGRSGAQLWSRTGIEPGAELFAMPRGDRGTLPVFDVTTTPPSLLHTLDIGENRLNHVVSLVAGRRVYAKEDRSTRLRAWDFSDGVKLLWDEVVPGIDNEGQAYLGYYKGNVVVPGKACIFFIDENSGLVNYRFCAPKALERYRTVPQGRPRGYPPYILSYAFLNGYLIGASKNCYEPFYAWEVPETLIPASSTK